VSQGKPGNFAGLFCPRPLGKRRRFTEEWKLTMKERRLAGVIRLPSTLQLKHQILRDRFEEAEKRARLNNAPRQDTRRSIEGPAP
jgi:hypothetical protein